MVVRLASVTDGIAAVKISGKTGAPAWVGDRLMLFWRRLAISEVLPADKERVGEGAQAGCDRKRDPCCRRTTVRLDTPGDHAKSGARPDVVAIGANGLQELQVVAQPGVQRQAGANLPLVLRVDPKVRDWSAPPQWRQRSG